MSVADTSAWGALTEHADSIATRSIRELFAADSGRGAAMSVRAGDLYIDYSKHRINGETLRLLHLLARETHLFEQRDAMLRGDRINVSENRSVLHTALRRRRDEKLFLDGHDVVQDVHAVLDAMGDFTDRVRDGSWTGADGGAITTVVNIGIGGSDLGPVMVHRALREYCDGPDVRFVSNVDPSDLLSTLADLDPATTLFVVVSKTFSTFETMANAHAARRWLVDELGEDAVGKHFVAVSTNADLVAEFGIEPSNVFGFWDWVGGRYSVGSAVGLSVMAAIGRERFAEFLEGFRIVDEHFATAPIQSNAPVILGLLSVWYASVLDADARAVLPYANDLARLPAYLQQLAMESNGKSVRGDGKPVGVPTGEVIWGEAGTNGQHAFHQLLHQGTRLVPADFIGFARAGQDVASSDGGTAMHEVLTANMFAQSRVLAFGKTRVEVIADGVDPNLAPHKVMPGDRPSTTILAPELSPSTLGQIIALYEHQVFVQGAVWGIDSFDQWGVELGKASAVELAPALASGGGPSDAMDSSTRELVAAFWKERA
ncbi:glucose-6-phosphate isomerase [Gordonia humi]|uniref:Glucose-6-phosphate isomerase n=1 Tax=Gordonia humi TaxID=686429 RepID=A0A840ET80_9ACTN|nr:glucose-6-phosphate isomerase [Gordonia humi]MBB4134912.1 glucose-6-phosphate isomerase [Gordonia humi]